jgi:hypothetical protein
MSLKLHLACLFSVSTLLIACSASSPPASLPQGAARVNPVFLKGEEDKGFPPFPHILRETTGRLAITRDGCVIVDSGPSVENLLIIWPANTIYNERRQTFETPTSGAFGFGTKLAFTGTPVQRLEVSKVRGVQIPRGCQGMPFILAAGVRKL